MELSSLPPRMELAAQPTATVARVPQNAMATKPETALPVLATPPTMLPAPIKGLGIAPLDLFLVGDNDEIPTPPEPPRKPAALAVIEPEETDTSAEVALPAPGEPPPTEAGSVLATAASATDVSETSASETLSKESARPGPPEAAAIYPKLVATVAQGPENPTMDIRR